MNAFIWVKKYNEVKTPNIEKNNSVMRINQDKYILNANFKEVHPKKPS